MKTTGSIRCEIIKEVDWNKVEMNTLVTWCEKEFEYNMGYYGKIGFYRGKDKRGRHLVAKSHFAVGVPVDCCMLLADWLKEDGGQDE